MTKRELADVQNTISQWDEYVQRRDDAFMALRDMSKQYGLPALCSPDANVEQLTTLGDELVTYRALRLCLDYYKYDALAIRIVCLAREVSNMTFPLNRSEPAIACAGRKEAK